VALAEHNNVVKTLPSDTEVCFFSV